MRNLIYKKKLKIKSQYNLTTMTNIFYTAVISDLTTIYNTVQPYYHNMLSFIVSSYQETTETLPTYYEIYKKLLSNFIEINQLEIIIVLISMFFILLVSIMTYQYYMNKSLNKMIKMMKDNEIMMKDNEIMKLIEQINELTEMNEKLKTQLSVYKRLRTGHAGYFIVKASPSNRETRSLMKHLNGRYLGSCEYLLNIEYLNQVKNKNMTIRV